MKYGIANLKTGVVLECDHIRPLVSHIKSWVKYEKLTPNDMFIHKAPPQVQHYFRQVMFKSWIKYEHQNNSNGGN